MLELALALEEGLLVPLLLGELLGLLLELLLAEPDGEAVPLGLPL